MTLNQTDLYNFDEVLANTRIDKFGRLREYYKLQDGKVVDFSQIGRASCRERV